MIHLIRQAPLNKYQKLSLIFVIFLFLSGCQRSSETKPFQSYWELLPDRYWIGPEYWANRLQDWKLSNGRVECINNNSPKRTLHLLHRYLSGRPSSLHMQVDGADLSVLILPKNSLHDSCSRNGFRVLVSQDNRSTRGRFLSNQRPIFPHHSSRKPPVCRQRAFL